MSPTRLFIIGDSISLDYGPYLQPMLGSGVVYDRQGGVEARLDDPMHASGANGGDSGMILNYLRSRRSVNPVKADLIAINCGLHDIKRHRDTNHLQVPPDTYRQNLSTIITEVRDNGAQPLWIRTTTLDEDVHNRRNSNFKRFVKDLDNYRAMADEVMAQEAVPVIDLYSFTLSQGPDLYRDHVHFHDPIIRRQASFISGWLTSYLVHSTTTIR